MELKAETVAELRKQAWVFAVACVVGLAVANTAHAQVVNLDFMDIGADVVKAIINHILWGVVLFSLAMFEVVMFGLTKNKIHLVGILIPSIAGGAWVARQAFVSALSHGQISL